LETGGEARFQMRPVEGVTLPPGSPSASTAEQLILDGQQRLTSLTQVLMLQKPVATRDSKKRELKLHYYFDIDKALQGPQELEDFHFACSRIVDSSTWEYELMTRDRDKVMKFMQFRQEVLDPFRNYLLPVITLKRSTSKEAVCLVFEKVNTGGVPLSVFELVTATRAADGLNHRDHWFGGRGKSGRHARLSKTPLLHHLQPTDSLHGVSLLHSLDNGTQD